MSILERNQVSSDLKSAEILAEYFNHAEQNSSRCVQGRRMYFGDRINSALDSDLSSLVYGLKVNKKPRLLRYLQDTSPNEVPPELQSFFNNCFTYYRRSGFCESMTERMETDIANNKVILVRDEEGIAYLFKHGSDSDKVVICLSDDGSAGVLDDWTMNLLHKSCTQKDISALSRLGSRYELKWNLPPKFFIARIQGMVKYTCFGDILYNVRQELGIPFVKRDRFTEKLVTL